MNTALGIKRVDGPEKGPTHPILYLPQTIPWDLVICLVQICQVHFILPGSFQDHCRSKESKELDYCSSAGTESAFFLLDLRFAGRTLFSSTLEVSNAMPPIVGTHPSSHSLGTVPNFHATHLNQGNPSLTRAIKFSRGISSTPRGFVHLEWCDFTQGNQQGSPLINQLYLHCRGQQSSVIAKTNNWATKQSKMANPQIWGLEVGERLMDGSLQSIFSPY